MHVIVCTLVLIYGTGSECQDLMIQLSHGLMSIPFLMSPSWSSHWSPAPSGSIVVGGWDNNKDTLSDLWIMKREQTWKKVCLGIMNNTHVHVMGGVCCGYCPMLCREYM